jgi:hypothetical protein
MGGSLLENFLAYTNKAEATKIGTHSSMALIMA